MPGHDTADAQREDRGQRRETPAHARLSPRDPEWPLRVRIMGLF
jgi:hypothetical protein